MTQSYADELSPREIDRLIKTAVTPRPIAWVSTVGVDGVHNLAPFSSYTYISTATPVLVFNASDSTDGTRKDTVRNAIDTDEFVVNTVTTALTEQMDSTAVSHPPAVSEFDVADVKRADSVVVEPPRVAEAVVSMECQVFETKEVFDKTMVFGEVVYFHVADTATTDGKIDSRNLNTIGRLGGPYYTEIRRLDIERST